MKTQLSILVKDSMSTFNPAMSLFSKTKVTMYIDGNTSNPIVLAVNKQPYVIEIAPGNHHITFEYNNVMGKMGAKLVGAAFGAGIGLAAGDFGSVAGAMTGAGAGSDLFSSIAGYNKVHDNVLDCSLNEGDVLKVQVMPKSNGKVKVTLL